MPNPLHPSHPFQIDPIGNGNHVWVRPCNSEINQYSVVTFAHGKPFQSKEAWLHLYAKISMQPGVHFLWPFSAPPSPISDRNVFRNTHHHHVVASSPARTVLWHIFVLSKEKRCECLFPSAIIVSLPPTCNTICERLRNTGACTLRTNPARKVSFFSKVPDRCCYYGTGRYDSAAFWDHI